MTSKKKLRKKIKRLEQRIAELEQPVNPWPSFPEILNPFYPGKWYANDTGAITEPDHVTASAPTWWEEPYWPE